MTFKENILGAASRVTIGEVRIDASRAETHTIKGIVTSHPVEEGIDVTDNYRVKPRELSIEGTITNTPLLVGFPLQTAIDGVRNIVAGNDKPVDIAWNELQRYFDESVVITITTSLREYKNMVLTSLSVTRNANAGDSLVFSLMAREIQFVSTRLVSAIPIPKETRGQDNKATGKDSNSESNDAQKAKLRSWGRKQQWDKLKGGIPQ